MARQSLSRKSLYHLQRQQLLHPQKTIEKMLKQIYDNNQIIIGWPKREKRISAHLARKNTVAVIGCALGDEGKGRIVDNKIASLLHSPHIQRVYVIRYGGGNNAGHTIEKNGYKLSLHVIPSGILHKKTLGIMDRGMVIHPEDLTTEVTYAEQHVGSLKNKLLLSEEAIVCTDLERAEEILNRIRTGRAKGGTGRGVGPSYAHHYDRLGLKMFDLLNSDWENTFGNQYDRYQKEFAGFDLKLANSEVPDFRSIKLEKKTKSRTVGNKKEFLERLEKARTWIIQRDMVRNVFLLHATIYRDATVGVVFEGAQGIGLDAWLGTRPDVTASDTSVYGIRTGTGFWKPTDIAERIGIIKGPYTSSVGERQLPTEVALPKNIKDLPKTATAQQKWAAFVRETAHEYGTTTGRPRDIARLDLAMTRYNAVMSGVEVLAVTLMDIAQENQTIQICTHYTRNGMLTPYQPGLRYQEGSTPHYVNLPGWDGTSCRNAKTVVDLSSNALKYLAFIQAQTGFPIVATTTGPARENMITFPGYTCE